MQKKGKVWLVGAGPFDAGLFTIKGERVLKQAEVVVYDKLVGEGILAMMPEGAEKISVGKSSGHHPVLQEEINQILLEKAMEGKRVVRLKGGDPFLFGRGGEELELLTIHQIPFEVVPGITSAISVPAYNGIPVTHRDYGSSVHIITAHKKRGSGEKVDYKALASLDGTLIFLMGVSSLSEICQGLICGGMDPMMPSAVLERGTAHNQRCVTAPLQDLVEKAKEERIAAPAIILVGKVCSLAEKFQWVKNRPLGGVRVVVTRPKRVASRFVQKLTEAGASVLELPTIETIPLKESGSFGEAIRHIHTYDWIVFTSEAAVHFFFLSLLEAGKDVRAMASARFAVVGPTTGKALREKGILADYMPKKHYGEELGRGLFEILMAEEKKKAKVCVFSPLGKESSCGTALQERQICCDIIPCYETKETEIPKEISIKPEDFIAFTSASTVRGFVGTIKQTDYHQIQAVCIGEQTAKEARKYGMKCFLSKEPSLDSMIEKMIELHQGVCDSEA